jgi:tripeptidyl-peptidase-1
VSPFLFLGQHLLLLPRCVHTLTKPSGDGGPGDGCMTNDGRNKTRFMPQFPASCPWVTSVGGTEQVHPEIATWLSGGGFSDVFGRPAYQAKQVGAYLNNTVGKDRFKGLYNRTGRGIPDVAAQAQTTFPMFHMGKEITNGGTRSVSREFGSLCRFADSSPLKQCRYPSLGRYCKLLLSRNPGLETYNPP